MSKNVIFVKGRWLIWKKPKDAQGWNRPMGVVRWARRICFEDVDPLALVSGRWGVADEVKEGEENPNFTRILMIWL